MEERRDAYQVIGTQKSFVDIDIKGRARTEAEKDNFIKEKAEQQLKLIEMKCKNPNYSVQDLQSLQRQAREVREAYEKVKNTAVREMYNAVLEEIKKQGRVIRPKKVPDAYQTLGLSRMQCTNPVKKEAQVDALIEKRKSDFIFSLKRKEMETKGFSEKQKISLQISRIEESYEKIKNADARKRYNDELDHVEEKRLEAERQSRLRLKYDKSNFYNEGLLSTKMLPQHKTIDKPEVCRVFDQRRGEIEISHIGEICFSNGFNMWVDNVPEYAITRMVKGEIRTDIVYTNLCFLDLSRSPKNGRAVNPQYEEYVMEELLSEDSIEVCGKYNHGYLGQIGGSQNGIYYTEFNKEKLSAIMKYYGERDKDHQQPGGGEK